MRQIWITRPGPPEVLEVREAPDPEAAAGQVRVRVRAAGINFADLMARLGLYPDAPKIPCVVGFEVSGVIDQVGAGVTGFSSGDRVLAMPRFGGYSDTVVLKAEQVYPLPERMSFEEGAALPVVYLTAHHMMLFTGSLRPGMSVLVHSAAGGVGVAALQLGRSHGCVLFGTTSPGKHDFVREQGCQHPLDPQSDWPAAVRRLTGERGLDLILDPVGGRSFKISYALLGPAGRLVMFGASGIASGKERSLLHAASEVLRLPKFRPMTLMSDNKTVSGVNMGHLFDRLDILRPQFEALLSLYGKGQIKPHVDRTFRFTEAAAAHHYLHDRKAKGKVLLVP